MIRWIKSNYHKYMIRPIITKTITRAMCALVVALLWQRYINRSKLLGLDYALMIIGLVLILFSWFCFLSLDGMSLAARNKKKKKKKTKRNTGSSMADYVDEDVVSYEELDEKEKKACSMAAYILSGVFIIAVGAVMTLF